MKKFFMLGILLPLGCLCQIHFDKGYFIDNEGNRTECLIRNTGWSNNPTKFDYRISEGSETLSRDIQATSEFGVDGEYHFLRATVDMERSNTRYSNLPHSAELEFKKETLFLMELVSGTVSLYKYEEGGMTKFFFRNADGKIEQLVFLRYLKNSTDVREFNKYHTQLMSVATCEGTTLTSLSNLEYTESSLSEYFRKVNGCHGQARAEAPRQKSKLYIRPVIGMKTMDVSVRPDLERLKTEFKKTDLSYGIELELILGSFKNKWAIILEGNYNRLKEDITLPPTGSGIEETAHFDYTSVQIPAGMRYYGFLTDDMKLFGNAMIVGNWVSSKSALEFDHSQGFTMEGFSFNFALGAGVSFRKLNLEFRYYTNQDLIQHIDSGLNKFSITASYAVF